MRICVEDGSGPCTSLRRASSCVAAGGDGARGITKTEEAKPSAVMPRVSERRVYAEGRRLLCFSF
jgi:hypothetical protein